MSTPQGRNLKKPHPDSAIRGSRRIILPSVTHQGNVTAPAAKQ